VSHASGPVSQSHLPKQFLITLQATASRITLLIPPRHISVVTAASSQAQTIEGSTRMPKLLSARKTEDTFVAGVKKNIALTKRLIEEGKTPGTLAIVSGSESARNLWQKILHEAKSSLQVISVFSLHEDLPVNQAFGVLLLWQRLRDAADRTRGTLAAFVFGSGTRSTPFTETDNAQKPAIVTPVRGMSDGKERYLTMVELAVRYFIPVQQYLMRSGFEGLIIKWGDEVQIPTFDLSGQNPELFGNADIVRFVSIQEMTTESALNKDWVGVNEKQHVTAFIPRRPLSDMEKLADRGLVQKRDGKLYGGVNLGSVAVSYDLLDALLNEFKGEVNDSTANRNHRPALDPEFFTALTIAVIQDENERREAWQRAIQESKDVQKLSEKMLDVLERMQKAIKMLDRPLKMLALDFQDQYWGDIGQHPQIYDFYIGLNKLGPEGEILRALGDIPDQRDENGNIIVGDSYISQNITVKNSVLINVTLTGQGRIENSVLIGTRAGNIDMENGFDVLSTATSLHVSSRGGTYKVVSDVPVSVAAGERVTTLFMPTHGTYLMRVHEHTNLRDTAATYDVPIFGNPVSFKDAHEDMGRITVEELERVRSATLPSSTTT